MSQFLSSTALSNLFTMKCVSKQDARCVIPESYAVPSQATRLIRARLLLEECLETIDALGFEVVGKGVSLNDAAFIPHFNPDILKVIDGCADLTYVAVGTLCSVGAPDVRHQEEVNRCNDAKFPNGEAILDTHGKYLKPKGWQGPDHKRIIETHAPINLNKVAQELHAGIPMEF